MADSLEAALAYLHDLHAGDARHAMWTARRRQMVPEPLPVQFIQSQPGTVAWTGASCDDLGIYPSSSDGAVAFVPWDLVLKTQPKDQT